MNWSDAGIVAASGLTASFASVLASSIAAAKVEEHFAAIRLDGDPVGFLPENIRDAAEMAIARFELWILAISGPIFVALNASSTAQLLRVLLLSGVTSAATYAAIHRIDRFDSPRRYVNWAEVTRPRALAKVLSSLNVGKIDLVGGLVVLVNVALVV